MIGPRWRYRLVLSLIWIAVVAAAVTGWLYARSSGPAYGPVVVVSVESLRADHLPVYGDAGVRTPAIDALAADSVIFDRAYAHSPLTLPSTVSLLSGRLPFQHGVRDEAGFPLPPSVSLLPQWLHRRGFKTAGIVSSCLLRSDTGLGQAFGFFDDEAGRAADGAPDRACGRDGEDSLKVAERWIESVGSARFFLFLHIDGPAPSAAPDGQAAGLSPYDARVAYADGVIGQLVAFLKKRGLYNGGILVLTSDHGEGLGDHGEQGHGLLLDEAALRTPLIVKMPRRDGGGRHSEALVEQADIAPTLLDLVGAPRPSGLVGISLRRVLDSPTATIPDRQIYAETIAPRDLFGWSAARSLTGRRYRYLDGARPGLYDLETDPSERANLAAADAKTAGQMKAALDKLAGSPAWPAPAEIPEADRARLAAFGYLSGLPVPEPADAADSTADPPADPGALIGVANRYFDGCRLAAQGRTDAAIAELQAVTAAAPTLAAAWDRLAGLLVESGRFKNAAGALTSLLKLYPEDARAAEADRRLAALLGTEPTADLFAVASSVWTSLGEKGRAAELRSAARRAVGDAALRKAEAGLR